MKKNEKLEIEQTYDLFREYREAYMQEWDRLEKCERMYHGDHWYDVPVTDASEPRPVTPIIQSTIENVRADLIDKMPEAIITADDPAHREIADVLSAVIRENHDQFRYEHEYGRMVRDLLVDGYMVQEIGYDASLNNGFGGAFIRHVDPRNIMFDPACSDIHDSRAVFKFTPHTRAWFAEHYPEKAVSMESDTFLIRPMRDDLLYTRDYDSLLFIECWRRKYDPDTGAYSIYMQKFGGRQLLEDSRDVKPEGYFAHGKYPFVVSCLYERRGSCLGYGFVDMFENMQRYSDKLDQIVLKNALMASHNKLLVTGASGFDVDDLRDWSKEVHRGENLNGVTWFSTAPLPQYIISYIQSIREAVKEESGANDFSRGNTNSGVTAASAIAALQEASSKRARMAARELHGAFAEAVRQEIEVEREFSMFKRRVPVKQGADTQMRPFSGDMLEIETALGNRIPLEFSVSVKVQQENRFSITANNELVLALVQTGIIPADVALKLLMFDGKEEAIAMVEAYKKEQEEKAAQAAQKAAQTAAQTAAQAMGTQGANAGVPGMQTAASIGAPNANAAAALGA